MFAFKHGPYSIGVGETKEVQLNFRNDVGPLTVMADPQIAPGKQGISVSKIAKIKSPNNSTGTNVTYWVTVTNMLGCSACSFDLEGFGYSEKAPQLINRSPVLNRPHT
jgi:hypothetical protein